MNIRRRLTFNLASNVVAQVVIKVFPVVAYALAQDRLGTEAFGFALFAIVLVDWTSPLIDSGTAAYGQVQIGQTRSRAAIATICGQIVALRLLIVAAVANVLIVVVWSYYPAYFTIVMSLSFLLISSALDQLYVAVGVQRSWLQSLWTISARMLALGALFVLITGPRSATYFAIILVGSNSFISLSSFIWTIRNYGFSWPRVDAVKKLFFRMRPYLFMVFWIAVMERFDYFFVERFFSTEQVGLYGGTLRVYLAVQAMIPALALAFGSEILSLTDRNLKSRRCRQAIDFTTALALAVITGGAFVAGDGLAYLYDETFRPLAVVFSVLTIGLLPYCFIAILGNYLLLAAEQVRFLGLATAGAAIVSVIAAVILTPILGIVGLALALLLGKVVLAATVYQRSSTFIDNDFWSAISRNVATCLPMALVLFLGDVAAIHWMVQIVLAGGTFLVVQFLMRWSKLWNFRLTV